MFEQKKITETQKCVVRVIRCTSKIDLRVIKRIHLAFKLIKIFSGVGVFVCAVVVRLILQL